jgi:PIN domain nuclease of toxin-antitoxin system
MGSSDQGRHRQLDVDMNALVDEIVNSGFKELPVTVRHAAKVKHLPDIHHDPFDRILIARAICEPLGFLTIDRTPQGYSELVKLI